MRVGYPFPFSFCGEKVVLWAYRSEAEAGDVRGIVEDIEIVCKNGNSWIQEMVMVSAQPIRESRGYVSLFVAVEDETEYWRLRQPVRRRK